MNATVFRRAVLGALALAALTLLAPTTPAAAQDDGPIVFEPCDYCEAPGPADPGAPSDFEPCDYCEAPADPGAPSDLEPCDYCEAPGPGAPEPFEDGVLYATDGDGDGLSDGEEADYGTLPNYGDTDGDGLLDGEEVRAYGTLPTDWNSDGDKFTDGDEVLFFGRYYPGCCDPATFTPDDDRDCLPDSLEPAYGSDPTTPHSDGDVQDDSDEFWHGTNPRVDDAFENLEWNICIGMGR